MARKLFGVPIIPTSHNNRLPAPSSEWCIVKYVFLFSCVTNKVLPIGVEPLSPDSPTPLGGGHSLVWPFQVCSTEHMCMWAYLHGAKGDLWALRFSPPQRPLCVVGRLGRKKKRARICGSLCGGEWS